MCGARDKSAPAPAHTASENSGAKNVGAFIEEKYTRTIITVMPRIETTSTDNGIRSREFYGKIIQ